MLGHLIASEIIVSPVQSDETLSLREQSVFEGTGLVVLAPRLRDSRREVLRIPISFRSRFVLSFSFVSRVHIRVYIYVYTYIRIIYVFGGIYDRARSAATGPSGLAGQGEHWRRPRERREIVRDDRVARDRERRSLVRNRIVGRDPRSWCPS